MPNDTHKPEPLGPSESTSPFFVAKHNNRSVAIKRTTEFKVVVESIRKAIPALKSSQIILLAQFSEFGNEKIEIGEELWEEVLPTLKAIWVSTDVDTHQAVEEPGRQELNRESLKPARSLTDANSQRIKVNVGLLYAGAPSLLLPMAPNMTVRQLKDLIIQHDDTLPSHFILTFGLHPNLEETKQLHEYGIHEMCEVSVSPQFDARLVLIGCEHPATLLTFATIKSLKLLYLAKAGSCRERTHPGLEPNMVTLMCAGEILDDTRRIGSYSQIIPGCTILANRARVQSATPPSEGITLRVYVSSAGRSVEEEYYVMSDSPVIDLKALITGTRETTGWARMRLSRWSGEGIRDDAMVGETFNSGDKLRLALDWN